MNYMSEMYVMYARNLIAKNLNAVHYNTIHTLSLKKMLARIIWFINRGITLLIINKVPNIQFSS